MNRLLINVPSCPKSSGDAHVSWVTQTANSFRDAALISEEDKGAITSATARSSCGHR